MQIYKLHTNEHPLGMYVIECPTFTQATAYARSKMSAGVPLANVIFSWTEIQVSRSWHG